jgi:hypothetical protein
VLLARLAISNWVCDIRVFAVLADFRLLQSS